MNNKVIAIDIGNKTTKIVCGVASKKNIIVKEYAIIDTPTNSIKDGHIVNVDNLALNICDALKSINIKSGNLVLNITGTSVITREIQIPVSTDEEISQMLEFEAQQYFPVDLQNYTLDFKALETISVGETMQTKVLLVAAPNKQIEEYIKLARLLKLQLIALDIPANCMLKFVRLNANVDDGEYAVINIGLETTEVCIFNKECLKFSRILLNGSADIDRLIANSYNVSLSKAEDLKINYDSKAIKQDKVDSGSRSIEKAHEEVAVVSEIINPLDSISELKFLDNTIDSALNNIVSDINRFIDFYNSRENSNHVAKLFICGGGSRLSGLTDYFATYFNLPVAYMPVSNQVVYKGKKSKNDFERDYLQIVNALGGLIRI